MGVRNRDVNGLIRQMEPFGWYEDREARMRERGDRFTLVFGCQV